VATVASRTSKKARENPNTLAAVGGVYGWVDHLRRRLRSEISHFLSIYKDLDVGRYSSVGPWRDQTAALLEIEQSRVRLEAHREASTRD
jgi:hypothetical protein